MKKSIILLLALCNLIFATEYSLKKIQSVRHDNFVLDFSVSGNAYSISFSNGDFIIGSNKNRLTLYRDKGAKEVCSATIDPTPHSSLTIRHRNGIFEALLDGKRVLRTLVDGITKGDVSASSDSVQCKSYQRLESFVFGDDFMRTEEEAKSWGLWEPVSGDWKIHSVMERIHANPSARIREGREPVPDRSPNPFCIAGSSKEGEALIVTGQPFWCEYEYSATVRPAAGCAFGLAFSVKDRDNFWYVKCVLPSLGLSSSTMELLERSNGKDTLISSVKILARAENWHRISVKLRGNSIRVFVDKVEVSNDECARCTGGKIGLFAMGTTETRFDDIDVKSLTDISFPLYGYTEFYGGQWRMGLDEAKCMSEYKNPSFFNSAPANGFLGYGLSNWKEAGIEAEVEGYFGLATSVIDKKNYCFAECNLRDRSKASIVKIIDGKQKELVSVPYKLKTGKHLACIYIDNGCLCFRIDGTLILRCKADSEIKGKCGIIGDKGTAFSKVRAFAEPEQDWEKPVEVEKFANDPFMQGWASTRYSWIRQTQNGIFPEKHLFTGDIYGAFKLDSPLIPGLSFIFGNDNPEKNNAYRLYCKLDENTGNGELQLERCGKIVASASLKDRKKSIIPGSQIVDEKIGAQPRTPDTPSYGKLKLTRDGHAICCELDGKELFCFIDSEPLNGRGLATEVPCVVDFIHFGIVREKLLDYLFEKAESDWGGIGRWEVTNRFACDPRWSHENGESRGVASIWSKFELEGDYTIECFAGMRMRQGDLLEGAKMSYPRVGDINVALNGDGHELFSGYNLIIEAWDEKWSEEKSYFMRQENKIAESDKELIPRGRHHGPKARAIEQTWDPGGRPVHGAWYAMKIRKTGDEYSVWFDQFPLFKCKDKEGGKIAGRKIALWTQYNSIVIARMKVGYSKLVRNAPIAMASSDRPNVNQEETQQTYEGGSLKIDFEDGLHGVAPWNEEQSAELSIVSSGNNGNILNCRNANSGGDFGVKLPATGLNLRKVSNLSFDFKGDKDAKVNLYFTANEDTHGTYFVTICGPEDEMANMRKVGAFKSEELPNGFRRCSIDLSNSLSRILPWAGSMTCSSMMIGMLHEGYLNAGCGGNYEGTKYQLDNIAIELSEATETVPKTQPSDNGEWGFNPITIAFGNTLADVPILSACELTIGKNILPANHLTTRYDASSRTLTFLPLISAIPQEQLNAPIQMAFKWQSAATNETHTIEWCVKANPSLDKTAPLPPIVDPAMATLTPDTRLESKLKFDTKDKDVLLYRDDNGRVCARVTGTVAASDLKINTSFGSFNAPKYPMLFLDYKIPEDTYVDISIPLQGRKQFSLFGLTDNEDNPNLLLKKLEGVKADGEWHSISVNLVEALTAMPNVSGAPAIDWMRQGLKVTNIEIGNFGYNGSRPGSSYEVCNIRLAPLVNCIDKPLRFSWASPDAGGIKGYSVLLDQNEDSIPESTITHSGNQQVFSALEDGLHFLHVRACDNNGNWSKTTHAPIFVENKQVIVSRTEPAEQALAAVESIDIYFSKSASRPDFSDMQLILNGMDNKNYRSRYSNACSWNEAEYRLTFNLKQFGGLGDKLKDGKEYKLELLNMKNASGKKQDFVLNWKLDYASDHKSPSLPTFNQQYYNIPFAAFESYEPGQRMPWNGNAKTEIVQDEENKAPCLKISFEPKPQRATVTMLKRLNVNLYASIFLRYKIMPGSEIDLLINAAKQWSSFPLCGPNSKDNPNAISGIIADGNWHEATIDMKTITDKLTPDEKAAGAFVFAFGNHSPRQNSSCMYLDCIAQLGKADAFVTPLPIIADASGFGKHYYKISPNSDDIPDMETSSMKIPPFAVTNAGLWYLHLQTSDGAGNRNRLLHIPFICNTPAQTSVEDGIEALDPVAVTAFTGKAPTVNVHTTTNTIGSRLAVLNFYNGQRNEAYIFYNTTQNLKQSEIPGGIKLDAISNLPSEIHMSAVAITAKGTNKTKLLKNITSEQVHSSTEIKLEKGSEWKKDIVLKFEPPLQETPSLIGIRVIAPQKTIGTLALDNIFPFADK